MKTLFYTKTLIALAVAIAAAASAVSQAQEQPIPPPATESALPASALPANIVAGSPLAEVVKMVQAGVEAGTIKSYILNSQNAFNLDADQILFLKDMGVPSELVNAMMERDKVLYAASVVPPPAPAPVSTAAAAPPVEPPTAPVTVNYFYDTLTPYGSWVSVDGYGRCWRPTTVIYDSGWRPYCDRGHWVYTDCGWYWDSDYAWGATFHYGRWFNNARYGWCWYPDTVWAPSWVTWRSGGDYCGWAPLPPLAVFTPGVGFYYHGVSVGFNFDFGLNASCFSFVSSAHFYDHHPRNYCVPHTQVTQIYNQTTIINNYNVHNQTIVNHGIPVDHISSVAHHRIEPVQVSSLPNATRQGWRGQGFEPAVQRGAADNHLARNISSGNSQVRRNSEQSANANNNTVANQQGSPGQTARGIRQSGSQSESAHATTAQNLNGRANNTSQAVYQGQRRSEPAVNTGNNTGNNYAQQSQRSYVTPGVTAMDRRVTQNNVPSGGRPVQSSSPQPQALPSRQVHTYESPLPGGVQEHGATQLQQRNIVTVPPPPMQSVQRSYNPPPPAPATTHSESHSANTGSSSGSNRGTDQSRQNH